MIKNSKVFCFFLIAWITCSSADYIIDIQTAIPQATIINQQSLPKEETGNITLMLDHSSNDDVDGNDLETLYFLNDDSYDAMMLHELVISYVNILLDSVLQDDNLMMNQTYSNGDATNMNSSIGQIEKETAQILEILIQSGLENIFEIYEIEDSVEDTTAETIEKFYVERMKFWKEIDFDHQSDNQLLKQLDEDNKNDEMMNQNKLFEGIEFSEQELNQELQSILQKVKKKNPKNKQI